MIATAKKLLARTMLRLAPRDLALWTVRKTNRYYLLPEGRNYLVRNYLGNLCVLIDPVYPIEREMATGTYDRRSLAVIRHFVKKGAVCFDIGANVGALSLAMAQAGAEGVYAFEPGPTILKRLEANIHLNPSLSHVIHPIPLGLAEKPGTLYWFEDLNNRGNAGLTSEKRDDTIAVEVDTVDRFVSKHPIPRLDFVKIDVEGMELEVIQGGLNTWARFRPVLYFETLREFEAIRRRPLFAEIEKILSQIDYGLAKFEHGCIVPTTSSDLPFNTLALPRP